MSDINDRSPVPHIIQVLRDVGMLALAQFEDVLSAPAALLEGAVGGGDGDEQDGLHRRRGRRRQAVVGAVLLRHSPLFNNSTAVATDRLG